MRILILSQFIFFGLLLGIASTPNASLAAAPSCQKLFDEPTSSFVSQIDPEFKKYGLLEDNKASQLCGITSLANLLALIQDKHGRTLSKPELIKFISEESIDFLYEQRMSGNRSFSIKGMYSFDLAMFAEHILQKLSEDYKIFAKSELLADQEIHEADLAESKLGIWSLQFISQATKELGASHFVLILNYDPLTKEITFSDPLDPSVLKYGKLIDDHAASGSRSLIKLELIRDSEMKELVGEDKGYYEISGIIGFKQK